MAADDEEYQRQQARRDHANHWAQGVKGLPVDQQGPTALIQIAKQLMLSNELLGDIKEELSRIADKP